MHLQSEKVTSTCSQRFAELDPHCPSMLGGACESFKAAADACRLSWDSCADSRHLNRRCAGRACAAPPRSNRWSGRCRHDSRPIPGRDSRSLDEADTISAAGVGELRHLLPAAKLTARRRSVKVRPVLASPHHPRCPLSLWRSAAGPPASTLIGSQRRLIWAPLRPQPASVASSSHRLSLRTDSGDHTHYCPSRGQHGTASKVPYQILLYCGIMAGGRG